MGKEGRIVTKKIGKDTLGLWKDEGEFQFKGKKRKP